MGKEGSVDRRQLLLAGLGGLVAQLGARVAAAQDPVKVMPRSFRVVLENDKVRVLEYTSRPGMGICGEGMHSHPERLNIVLSGWESRVSTPDAKSRENRRKDGEVFWAKAVTHKVENIGKSDSRVLMVELKSPGKAC